MKIIKRTVALILSVIMLVSIVTVSVSASDYSFSYFFVDEEQTSIYVTAFKGVVPEDGYVEIPDMIDDYVVTGIAEHTFDNLAELKGVYIPETVVYVDEDAFYGCVNKISVEYKQPEPDPDQPVYDSEGNLDTENWYEDHKQDYIISGTTLVSYKGDDSIITIPYNCNEIAAGAFKGNKQITAVYIEKELKAIGASAFEGCSSLEKVVAGNGVTSIDIAKNAFKGTPWIENFPSGFVTIGTTLVKYKGAESYVVIPNVFTAIAEEAFYAESKNDTIAYKIKVPATIELFSDECFYLYDSLSKVYPEFVVFEGSPADKYCQENDFDFTYAPLPGDIDRDGVTTASDARYVLRISAGLENPVINTEIKEIADISGDSEITATDARLILRVSAELDEYSAEELLSMPRSNYEILFEAANAVSIAKAYRCAYSKFAYQEITASDVNTNTKTYINKFKNELTPEKSAQTITYNQDSQESYDNLYAITLLDGGKVKEAKCILDEGYYILKLVLEDEKVNMYDVDGDTFTSKMFPVESMAHFTNAVKDKYWFNDGINGSMTYRDCTLEMRVDVKSHRISSMSVKMNYDFEMTGKILSIAIKGKNGPATATRTDVIEYSHFVYFTK